MERVRIEKDGTSFETPDLAPTTFRFSPRAAGKRIGVPLDTERAADLLRRMRHGAQIAGDEVTVAVPAYRNDVLHEVDLVEDAAIAIGYDAIPHRLIPSFTLGRERPERILARRVREAMLGLGFREAMSLLLTNEKDLYENVRAADPGDAVRAENPVSVEHRILRTALAPGLLRLLERTKGAGTVLRLFEVDDVVRIEEGREEPVERLHVAAVMQGPAASFADIKSIVVALTRELGPVPSFRASKEPVFLDGRGADLLQDERKIGHAGEVHPEVLERFLLGFPVTLFEIELDERPEAERAETGGSP
jgi:phenylalanyl-tRNA synthetase beta chain